MLLAAGDTFRAAAAEQLQVWADRSGVKYMQAHERMHALTMYFIKQSTR